MKEPLFFLKHILEAINDIESSLKGFVKQDFKSNKDIRDAVIRRIEIIGEAVKNLPEGFKRKYPRVPWKEIVGMRDKLIHHYFGVDLDAVWEVTKKDIPELKKEIEKIIKKEA